MMQLGFVTAIVPDLSFEEVLQTASSLGYDCVEAMCWPVGEGGRRYAGATHIDVSNLDVDGVQASLQRHGVSVSALGYYPNPLTPDAEEAKRSVAHLRELIAAAAKLGIGRVNSFVGRDWTKGVDENWSRFVETWKPLIEHAEAHDVRVGIENCPMLFTADEWPGGKNLAISPEIWCRMFDSIPSDHFGLNYDPSHMVFQQMDYLAPIREFIDRIFHVHAKDVRVDQHRLDRVGILAHPNDYHSPKLPGMGDVDWGNFFSVLTDAGYRGPVCVEVEDRAFENSLDDRVLALRQSHTFLRNFVPKRPA